jgi:hypothetical protein
VQRKKTFLVVCFSILTLPLWAQTPVPVLLINRGLERALPLEKEVTLIHPISVVEAGSLRTWMAVNTKRGCLFVLPLNVLYDLYGSGYYMGNLGYFCRKEVEIEKMTHLPLRFRLGSLAEVNRLEGKPGW